MSQISLAECHPVSITPAVVLTPRVPPGLPGQTATTSIPRGRVLFWQDERQSCKIDVIHGVVRAVRLLEDGNRQILAFYWPGDTLYPLNSACQQYTAEAVTNCCVLFYSVSLPCDQQELFGAQQVLSDALTLITAMGRKNILQRIAWFLLRIKPHLPRDPHYPHALQTLIPRADIADHLGTSLETVCRALADFRNKGLIDLPNRKTIRFIDIPGLTQIAGD
jgi:CRP/FNR family transcriptional regulator, anaerobic regulatory protein